MRLVIFTKLALLSACIALLAFAFLGGLEPVGALKIFAVGMVASIAGAAFYPEMRGVQRGDTVSAVATMALPAIMGRYGRAVTQGRKDQQIKVRFDNGEEALAVVESYAGLVSPPKVRILYEEKLVE